MLFRSGGSWGLAEGSGVLPAPWAPFPGAGVGGAHSVVQAGGGVYLGWARTTPILKEAPLPPPTRPTLESVRDHPAHQHSRSQFGKELVPPLRAGQAPLWPATPTPQAQRGAGHLVELVSDLQAVQAVHIWVVQRPGPGASLALGVASKAGPQWGREAGVLVPALARTAGASGHSGPQFPHLLHGQ